jgi:hypothetical protein
MIYIQYHQGQPQSGHSEDNVRSLRCAIKTSSWTTFHTSCIFTNCPSANVLPALSFLYNPRPSPRAQPSQIGHCLRVCARPAPVPCCHGCAREIGDRSRSPSVSKSSPPEMRPTSNLRTSKPRTSERSWISSPRRNRATIPTPPSNRPMLAQPRST